MQKNLIYSLTDIDGRNSQLSEWMRAYFDQQLKNFAQNIQEKTFFFPYNLIKLAFRAIFNMAMPPNN